MIHLSRAIDAGLEAVMVPALFLLAVVLVIAATGEMIRRPLPQRRPAGRCDAEGDAAWEPRAGRRGVTTASEVMTASAEGTSAPARSVDHRLRVARDRRGDSQARATRARMRAVDRALDLLERSGLSASELRILLAVRDGELSVSALAEAFDRRPVQLRRTAARLYARGLLHWRHDAATKEAVFEITPAGRAMVRPLLSVGAGSSQGVRKQVQSTAPKGAVGL